MFPDTVTPRVSSEEMLYEHFRRENWWARNSPLVWIGAYGLVTVTYFMWVAGVAPTTQKQWGAALILLLFAWGVTALLMWAAKEILYDRPWKKYRDGWKLTTDDN